VLLGFSGDFFGYVTEGPLLDLANEGMPQDESHRRCNSPFWPSHTKPWFATHELVELTRTYFGNHAWTEVWLAGQGTPLVLETCHASLDQTVQDVILTFLRVVTFQ
jgi:hypothetical protein